VGEMTTGTDGLNRIGAILEQLGARFELVLEAVTGFGGRLDALRNQINSQFTEVGRQVRFISDNLAQNREAIVAARADLGAEMVRLGEMLGATRVELREQLASLRNDLNQSTEATVAGLRDRLAEELARETTALSDRLKGEIAAAGDALRKELAAARVALGRELPHLTATVREEVADSAQGVVKKIDAELKQTNKALAALARKFERFDDRITVQTRDQDQRLRKLERQAGGR